MESSTVQTTFNNTEPTVEVTASAVTHTWLIVWYEVILLAGIPGNVISILAFVKFSSLRSPSNYLIFSLSVADLMSCLASQVAVVIWYTKFGQEAAQIYKSLCLVTIWIQVVSVMVSMLHITALTVDRVVAVLWSLHYLVYITEELMFRQCIIIWLSTIVITAPPIFGWNTWMPGKKCYPHDIFPKTFQFVCQINFFIIMIILGTLNVLLGRIAFMKSKVHPLGSIQGKDIVQKNNGNFRITKMLLMVIGTNYITWIPVFTFSSISIFSNSQSLMSTEAHVIQDYVNALALLNTVANPCIYAWKDAKFRMAYRKLIHRIR